MDLIYLITIAITLLIVIVSFFFFKKSNTQKEDGRVLFNTFFFIISNSLYFTAQPPVRGAVVPERLQAGIPRRAQIARNQRDRNRNRAAANVENNRDSEQENSDEDVDEKLVDFGNEKIGTKKRAKLEAKAEKKSQREVELKIREDKKQKDLVAADEKTKLDELEKEEEKRQEELILQAEKEKAQAEHDQYLKLKEAFSVEEEGFEEDDEDKNQLEDFVNYIKVRILISVHSLIFNHNFFIPGKQSRYLGGSGYYI